MTKTQFFKREYTNLEEYKANFKKALEMTQTVKLFPEEVIDFFWKWIKNQTNYIPREDVDNFLPHLKLIFKNKHFYNFIQSELKIVKNNWKIQEYSFNLISKLDDSTKFFDESEKRRLNYETLQESKLNSRKEDKDEMVKILDHL